MLTALNRREHFLRGMQAGADDFLRKPLGRHGYNLTVRLFRR